jgi:hypothetical protein
VKKIRCLTVLALLALSATVPVLAQGPADPESAVHANWHATMAHVPTPDKGCFHASYPSIVWERVDCTIAPPRAPTHVKPTNGQLDVVGNGYDYVASVKELISSAAGTFSITGVTSENSVGVAQYNYGGILGANEYSVQLNTNDNKTTSACAAHKGCTVWQQFIYATDYIGAGKAAVFMEYWLLNWGSSACPSGWFQYGSDCVVNSPLAPAKDIPITDLGQLRLGTSVYPGPSRASG